MEKNQIIIEYLKGPRNYQEGVALYEKYGLNLMLKRKFRLDESRATKEIMMDALRKIAGLSQAEFDRLPRLSARPDAVEQPTEVASPTLIVAPESVQRQIRFRDRFPFLKSQDCPDVFKVLVADMFSAHDSYVEDHRALREMPDSTIAPEKCEAIVESYLVNREIWAEIEYYQQNGRVLGESSRLRGQKAIDDVSSLGDGELVMKLQSARTNVSKALKRVEAADDDDKRASAEASLQMWQLRKAALEEERERRKKKS